MPHLESLLICVSFDLHLFFVFLCIYYYASEEGFYQIDLLKLIFIYISLFIMGQIMVHVMSRGIFVLPCR